MRPLSLRKNVHATRLQTLLLAALLLFTLGLFNSKAASAYVFIYSSKGKVTRWANEKIPVEWYLHKDGCPGLGFASILQATLASFNAWEFVDCSRIAFEYRGSANTGVSELGVLEGYDERNVLMWAGENEWPEEWQDAFAVTIPLFNPDTGANIDVDILFNSGFEWTTRADTQLGKGDIQNILTHELGHFIGLDHPEPREATMYYAALTGETYKRTLAADDIQGACALYPKEGETGFPCETTHNCKAERECIGHAESGGSVCALRCDCPTDCSPAFDCIDGFCLPPAVELGDLGAPCSLSLPCGNPDMICVDGFCSIYCINWADCPEDWTCRPLMGGQRACWSSNPDQDAERDIAITSIDLLPDIIGEIDEEIVIQAESEGTGHALYRFSYREYGGLRNILRDFSPLDTFQWTPEDVGAYEIVVEVRHEDSTKCYEDMKTMPFTALDSSAPQSDPDGDNPFVPDIGENDDSGGCRETGQAESRAFLLSTLSLIAFAILRKTSLKPTT